MVFSSILYFNVSMIPFNWLNDSAIYNNFRTCVGAAVFVMRA